MRSNGSQLPSSCLFLSCSSTVSNNRANAGHWEPEKGLWLLHWDFLKSEFVPSLLQLIQTAETVNITDEKKCDATITQFGNRDVATTLCSVSRKNIRGRFKNLIDTHTYIHIQMYIFVVLTWERMIVV